jgi:periplasmic protein TonB
MLLASLLLIAHPLQASGQCAAPAPAGNPAAYGPHASGDGQGSNSRGPWVTRNDYPAAAKRANQQGTVYFTLDIDTRGCPTACHVTRSSGYETLDDATCPILMRRARFQLAVDASGTPIPTTWSNKFTWALD